MHQNQCTAFIFKPIFDVVAYHKGCCCEIHLSFLVHSLGWHSKVMNFKVQFFGNFWNIFLCLGTLCSNTGTVKQLWVKQIVTTSS